MVSLLTDKQATVNLHVQQMTNSVQLIDALGCGWSGTDLPTEKSLTSRKELS
jgi:hypothetical protein